MDDQKPRPHSMRASAFLAIVLATGAITSCMISFPLIFTYIQSLESQVQTELDLCKASIIKFLAFGSARFEHNSAL
ncbi:unnamed protein product [Gongylonema pulchrum]|uniref:Col_cuticle_N domain-containing protein n=1 Tax=Gongylonema pulchrum TaxID=637853 RepID=A0A183EY46_9BILA|nr:unnamed protein product [Gongylonema pulchrum]